MEPSRNFDLRLSGTLSAVNVEVIDSPAGQTTAPAVLSCNFDPNTLGVLHDILRDRYVLKPTGGVLWRCAFGAPAIAELWRASRAALGDGGVLRLRLIIDSAELAALPWELLYDETLGRFLSLDAQTPVTRFTRLPIPSAPWPQDRPLRLLFTGSSPSGSPTLNVAKEWTGIERMIAPLVKQGKLETPDPLPEGATLRSLLAALRRKVDIWHFAGHGTDSGLIFCNDYNKPNLIDAGELGQMLLGEGVRLAVINACKAGGVGGQAASVAGALLWAGIPSVVAMQGYVSDAAADAFAGAFYDAIAVGQGVDQAVTAARKAIWAAGESDWWTPALFMRTPEGRLWDRSPTSGKTTRQIRNRRIDAAAPSAAEIGRPIDVLVQVRFPDSPFLGADAWSQRRRPEEIVQESEAVAMKFAVDPATGTLKPAALELRIVAPTFEVAGSSQVRTLVPPDDFSPLVRFTLTPTRRGQGKIDIEVYDLGQRYLGSIPLDTEVTSVGRLEDVPTRISTIVLIVRAELTTTAVLDVPAHQIPESKAGFAAGINYAALPGGEKKSTALALARYLDDGGDLHRFWPDGWTRPGAQDDAFIGLARILLDMTPLIERLLDINPVLAARCIAESGGERPAEATVRTVQKRLVELMTDPRVAIPERNAAGMAINYLGDPRPGVGLRPDGMPDIKWVLVPERDPKTGRREFIYGAKSEGNREVRTERDFWIARYPITYRQFQAFLDAADGFRREHWWQGLEAPPEHRREAGEQRFKYWNHPREDVSWWDAMAFCAWLTAKAKDRTDLLPVELDRSRAWKITLPTEWQWEKAARGHDGRQYPWGGDEYRLGYANIDETWSSYKVGPHYLQKTSAVGMYPQGVSPYGVADLSGNVWEWCLNEYKSGKTDPGGNATRVLRGGSWGYFPNNAAAPFRHWRYPGDRYDNFGFRVCAVLPPP